MSEVKSTRLDQFLWAIRLFKTRTQASKNIADGKVKFNGEAPKPSRIVHIGEVYQLKLADKRMTIQVSGIINKRVKYAEAILNYFDISSPEDLEFNKNKLESSFFTGKRQSKVGRPTKKNQRDLIGFLDNDEISAEIDNENIIVNNDENEIDEM